MMREINILRFMLIHMKNKLMTHLIVSFFNNKFILKYNPMWYNKKEWRQL